MNGSSRHISIILGLFALVLAWIGNPVFIPDSYEQIILAECWANGSSTRIDCDAIFPWFRPPLPSLMTALGLRWFDGFSAILLLSWGASVGKQVLGSRCRGPGSRCWEHVLWMEFGERGVQVFNLGRRHVEEQGEEEHGTSEH